jgi:DNA-binding CsgD family transcriptional regulator/tetratricopeptide (TPR) repeat protein
MVGRASELVRLRRLAQTSGDPRVALVSGEAGSGKTRLVQELLADLPASTRAFTARAEEGAMGRPFALLLEAVGPDVATWETVPDGLAAWKDALGTLLGPVAPGLLAEERPYASDELLRSAAELVRYLAGGAPAVAVFEDLHWADADSLGLFQRLSVTPGLDFLLVGTFRPEDLDRRHLTDLLAAVERHKRVEHLNIGRLGVRNVASLIAAIRSTEVDYPTAAALHSRTGGNPFFLEELLVTAGDVPVGELADYPLPKTLTEAVLRHLDGLELEERRAVDAASILGERIPFDLLTSVTGLGEDRLLDALRTLVDRGLVVEESADVFSFRHALTREAVAGRLLGRERRRLHEKALAALEETGSNDWAALAHHARAAGRLDEMVAAARQGASSYLRSGATYQALRLAELALHEGEADAELLELATLASWSVGLLATAVERAEQWRTDAMERSDDASLARALRLLARLRWETENPEAHRQAVDQALEVAERLAPGEDRAWVANLAAEASMLEGDTAAAVGWADEAMAAAGPSPSVQLRAAVLVNKGSTLLDIPGEEDLGVEMLQEALVASIAAEDHQSTLRALNNLCHHVMPIWEPSRSSELLDQMREVIGRTGRQDWYDNWVELKAIFLAHVQGDLAAARAAVSVHESVRGKRWMALVDGELSFEAGDLDRADQLLSFARAAPRSGPAGATDRGYALGIAARVASRRQNPAAVIELLTHLAGIIDGLSQRRRSTFSDAWYGALTAACRSGISLEQVEDLERLLRDPLLPGGHQGDPAWPDHLRAAKAELGADLQGAVDSYSRAVTPDGWRRSVPARADALLGLARVQLVAGDRAGAKKSASRASGLLDRWPGWRRDEARALIRRLEAAGSPSHDGDLTPREREVAVLVAEGLSNGEIGRRLFISTKTASVHVSAILRKLAMSNRSEIAAWAVRSGMVPQ